VRQSEAAGRVASPDDPKLVPVLRDLDGTAVARHLVKGGRITATIDGFTFRFALPAAAGGIVGAIDGRRSLGDIQRLLAGRSGRYDWIAFQRDWRQSFDALNGLGKLYLRRAA
jgi:hypothetical protein